MKKIVIIFFLFANVLVASAGEYFSVDRCKNPYMSCLSKISKAITRADKMYKAFCTPYYSFALEDNPPFIATCFNGMEICTPESEFIAALLR